MSDIRLSGDIPQTYKRADASYSSMDAGSIHELYRQPLESIDHLLSGDGIASILNSGEAEQKALVTLARLAIEYDDDENITEIERPARELRLYDLSPWGKIHCITIGRRLDSDLVPSIPRKGPDKCVSRQHGLVYFTDGNVFYYDIGTEKKGSKNGTWKNDTTPIINAQVPWKPEDFLAFGNYILKEDDRIKRQFRLRHKLTKNA